MPCPTEKLDQLTMPVRLDWLIVRLVGEVEPIESVVDKLRAVEAPDLLRVAQRLLLRDKATLAVVGPNVEEEKLAELVAG